MERLRLKAERRSALGKEAVKKIRRERGIPGVVYGADIEAVPVLIGWNEFNKLFREKAGGNALVDLEVPGAFKKNPTVMIKDVQHHPVTDQICHVDFQAIKLTERIRVKVPVHEVGESPGVKNGGILDHVHRDIEVECLPAQIPERIDVDISTLDFGHSIHVGDIRFPEGVVSTMDSKEVVFTVVAQRQEEPTPEATAGEAVEPEVIKKGKEDKVEEGGEEKKAAPAAEAQDKGAPKAEKTAPKTDKAPPPKSEKAAPKGK